EPARHRHHVVEAELLERLGRERRPVASGAEHHDRAVAVDELRLRVALQVAAGDEHRPGDRALVVLVLLPDVEERRRAQAGLGLLGLDLGDAPLGVSEQVAVARHRSLLVEPLNATAMVGYSQPPQIRSTSAGSTSPRRSRTTNSASGSNGVSSALSTASTPP